MINMVDVMSTRIVGAVNLGSRSMHSGICGSERTREVCRAVAFYWLSEINRH
jgi:hypothetical protein